MVSFGVDHEIETTNSIEGIKDNDQNIIDGAGQISNNDSSIDQKKKG